MSHGYHSDCRFIWIDGTYTKKRGASSVARFTFYRPWNCPIDRNEQRRKPHDDVYIQHARTLSHNIQLQEMFRTQTYMHPIGRPRCFVFDQSFEFSRFLERQNQSVQLRLLCICPHPYLSSNEAFSKSRCANIKLIIDIKQINI